jgi:hypothetical protein
MEVVFVGGFPIIDLVPRREFWVIAEELDNGGIAGFEEFKETIGDGFAIGLLGAFGVNGLIIWEGFKAGDGEAFMHLGDKRVGSASTVVKAQVCLFVIVEYAKKV